MPTSQREPVWERARGRWHGILTGLGVDPRHLTGKAGPCPICRAGRDRFVFDNRNDDGTFHCRQCGAGTGTQFVQRLHGVPFPEASRLIDEQIRAAPVEFQDTPAICGPDLDAIERLWQSAKKISPGDPVDRYLERRLGSIDLPADLRFHHRCWHSRGDPHPAMLALVRDDDGKPCQLHRTFLTGDGCHAEVNPVRMVMRGEHVAGSAVRLSPLVGKTLGVAEGIENALAAQKLFDLPVWATVTRARMQAWEPPQSVKNVIVFSDNDQSFAGQLAAAGLAHRIAGRVSVEIREPPRRGSDWNDELQRQKENR